MPEPLRSELGWASADRIQVRGFDLVEELIGEVSLSGMAFLELTGRLPDENEATMLDALFVTLVEHGVTPSALATRFTHLGAPGSLQSAVAAGLLGLGDRFMGTIEGAARMLSEALEHPEGDPDFDAIARSVVEDHRARRAPIHGLGHPLHRPVDPRTPRLFQVAEERGFAGPHVALMERIGSVAEEVYGRPLPVNATGAIGAIANEMGLDWRIARGIGIVARAVGLVGHVAEEMRHPLAPEIWRRVEDEVRDGYLAGGDGSDRDHPG